jgi:arginyl-tRNA--protein-N-Asp/Glu arginylyltransferase
MDAGFRRSGRLIYQPACGSCQQCIPLRVVVADFTPSKSQRRCRCRNDDLRITHGPPTITDQKWELYRRYLSQWHGRPVAGEAETTDDAVDFETFESFLYDSPVPTIEFEYRLPAAAGGQLLAVGICDISRSALSSVYFYFDPAHAARSLGTLGALHEIEWSAANDISHYYLGYWISGCGAMQYKASFRPHELLNPHGGWESPTEPTRDSP